MTNNTNALVTTIGQGGEGAKDQLLKLLQGKGEEKNEVRIAIRTAPQTVLAVIANGTSGLSLRGNADALDAIVEELEPAIARELVEQSLTPERRAELLAARGDLPSSAASILGAEDLIAAILTDVGDTKEIESAFVIRAWAEKLKERHDWQRLLKERIGDKSLERIVVIAVVAEAGDEMPSGDMFEAVGIDAERGFQLARKVGRIRKADIEEARANLIARRTKQKDAPLVEKAVEAASEAADKIDI